LIYSYLLLVVWCRDSTRPSEIQISGISEGELEEYSGNNVLRCTSRQCWW